MINLFWIDHEIMSVIHLLMRCTAVSLSLIGNVKYTWTSSAYIMELRPWAWMMAYIGALYREKRIGPMMEPWGTPHSSGTDEQEQYIFNLNYMGSTRQIWLQPILDTSTESVPPRRPSQHDVMINCVECWCKIKQYQKCFLTLVKWQNNIILYPCQCCFHTVVLFVCRLGWNMQVIIW